MLIIVRKGLKMHNVTDTWQTYILPRLKDALWMAIPSRSNVY